MDLWIRSQDKGLYKIVGFKPPFCCNENETQSKYAIIGICYEYRTLELGIYKTKERALEVLDDIQNKIQNQYLLKPKGNIKLDMIQDAKRYFENLNGIKIVTCDDFFEMSPINSNVVVYELPKE